MSTISMLYICIQYIVWAAREGKCWCAIEWVLLNCIDNSVWVHFQCIWEDRVRTQHIPVVASKERFSTDCHLCISLVWVTTTTFPIGCAWICSSTLGPLTGHRQAKITAFTSRAQRGIWKVNIAFGPTGLKVTLLASCWREASWPHRLWWGDERAQPSSYPWIDSAAFATSKPLRHSRGAPSPLKPYPFHANFYK